MNRAYIWKELKAIPKRVEPQEQPAIIRAALREVAVPKPEVPQLKPAAIPDAVHFEPLVVLPSNIGPGYYIEIDNTKHYGTTPLEALGQAVLDGAFGALNIVIP